LFDHNPAWVRGWEAALSGITRLRFGLLALLLSLILSVGVISLLIGGPARAQNLDAGKSAPRLFADGCAACHRSARGLAKGRFSLTLYLFLQNHYASNSSSAWALTSYLESLDDAPRGRSRAAAAKPSPHGASTSRSSPRPPKPVP
jgi:hypothetical protein